VIKEAFFALLFVSIFALEVFLGSLSIYSFSSLISSRPLSAFSFSIHPVLRLILPVTLLFLILIFNVRTIFPWLEVVPTQAFRHLYLNPWSFSIRNFVYFCIWIFLGLRLFKRQEIKPAAVLILVGLTATFFSIDWIESLDLTFRSTAFGLIFFISCLLLAFAFHIWQLPQQIESERLKKLNNIHLSLIGAWSYIVFAQFLVVWYGNIPAETGWYWARLKTNWSVVPKVILIFQFAIPIFLLLFQMLKKSWVFSRGLALITISMQALYLYWLIFPSLHPQEFYFTWFSALGWVSLAVLVFFLPRRLYATT
jgi:hypothetical protein